MRCMQRSDNALALHVIELKEELTKANNKVEGLRDDRVRDVTEHHAEKAKWDCERKKREGREENLKEKLNQTVAERERCIRELLKSEPVLRNMVENLQCMSDSFKKITSEKFEQDYENGGVDSDDDDSGGCGGGTTMKTVQRCALGADTNPPTNKKARTVIDDNNGVELQATATVEDLIQEYVVKTGQIKDTDRRHMTEFIKHLGLSNVINVTAKRDKSDKSPNARRDPKLFQDIVKEIARKIKLKKNAVIKEFVEFTRRP